MKNDEIIIGIDFGHGETSAALCEIGKAKSSGQLDAPKDLELGNNSKVIPSAICITKEDKAYIGESAFSPEILAKAEVFVCFKQAPKDIQGEEECLMKRYMREVYKRICENNSALLTSTNHCVYIATPSGWDKQTQELYQEMAKEAGLPVVGITTESRAAFVHAQSDPTSGVPKFIDKGAIVFDMGSSTLDFTYLKGHERPIDFGYNCGASYIEKLIYSKEAEKNEWVQLFEKRYRRIVPKLLFEARKVKEQIYFDPTLRVRQTIIFDDLVYEDYELEDKTCKYAFQPGELNQLLEINGYFQQLRDAMFDFKLNHINNEPIYGVFLTGGASRMDFIKSLIKECWEVDETRIFKDQDPSLTISRGIAEVGRADIRVSGQIPEIKNKAEKIINSTLIFDEFAKSLVEKLYERLEQQMGQTIISYKESTSDKSIQDLENGLKSAIQNCMSGIQELAKSCFNKTFEISTQQIRIQLEELIRNYSSREISIQVAPLSLKNLPAMKFDIINTQLAEITNKFMQENSGLLNGITGAAIGGVIGLILGGPLTWIVGGGYLLGKLFGPEKTEADKKIEAKNKKLNAEARAQVFNHFNENWENITGQLYQSIEKTIAGNQMIKNSITTETSKALRQYVNECLLQTRLILD